MGRYQWSNYQYSDIFQNILNLLNIYIAMAKTKYANWTDHAI